MTRESLYRLLPSSYPPLDVYLTELCRLSNERCLYLRLTSPHEAGESIGRKRHERTNFLKKRERAGTADRRTKILFFPGRGFLACFIFCPIAEPDRR
jgi:hypothetical protein